MNINVIAKVKHLDLKSTARTFNTVMKWHEKTQRARHYSDVQSLRNSYEEKINEEDIKLSSLEASLPMNLLPRIK